MTSVMKKERRKTIQLQELAIDRLAAQIVNPRRGAGAVAFVMQFYGTSPDDVDKIITQALRRQLEQCDREFRAAVVDEASKIAEWRHDVQPDVQLAGAQ